MPSVLRFVGMSLVLGACAPIHTNGQLGTADAALHAARTAGAEERSPYEYAAAQLYHQKAQELAGRAQYEIAMTYAERALGFATQARERALATSTFEPLGAPPTEPAP